jgi:hypothetical protein
MSRTDVLGHVADIDARREAGRAAGAVLMRRPRGQRTVYGPVGTVW